MGTTKQRLLSAFDGKAQGAFITFPTLEALWKALTPKRWDIIKNMTRAGPLAIREVSRRIERDVRAVHSDIQVLLSCGVWRKQPKVRLNFLMMRCMLTLW